MAVDDTADDICRRMAELRHELSSDVREVGRNARVMTNWRFYARRFPWAMAGLGLAAGYFLIPQRKEVKVISPDPDALAKMFKKEQLKLQTPASKQEAQGLTKTLLLMGLSWAAKTGMNYMGERVRTAAINKSHEPTQASSDSRSPPDSSPSPRKQHWPK